jgi:hypothetical protein
LKAAISLCLIYSVAACQAAPEISAQNSGASLPKVAIDAAARTRHQERQKVASRSKVKGCAIGAISVEQDLNGLNVRSAPSKDSPILGILQSLIETDPHTPDDPPLADDMAFGPSFTIIAIQGQWLKIADISPTTEGYDPVLRKRTSKRNYQGSGWVHRSRVAVDPGFHDDAYDQPYFERGNWTSIDDGAGALLTLTGGKQGYTAELLSCEQDWLQIRYQRKAEGSPARLVTGWFQMTPNYIGPKACARDDADCLLRQDLENWEGPH